MRRTITKLLIRPKTSEDDEWLVGLRNRINDHLPSMTVDIHRHWEEVDRQSEQSYNERLIAEIEDVPVGALFVEKMWWTKRPGGFHVGVRVDPARSGQGIGSRIYDHLLDRAKELQAERLYGEVREHDPHAQGFAERRGFTKTGHSDRWSRLEVAKANLDGYDGIEDRLAVEEVHIQTLAEIGESEEFLRKLHKISDEAVRDIPMSEEFTESPYEMFVEELRDPGLTPERVWVALHRDEPVGLAVLPLPNDEAAFNGFTGVVRAQRGKGVARALKLKTIEWSRENGVKYIFTANDINNKRMLAININLGYQPLPSSEELVKELA